jgi:hypothetical protein
MGKRRGNANDEPPKKRGNQGDFHGKRYEFLESQLETFRQRTEAKTTRDWWPLLWAEYWALFPWCLRITEEPPPNMQPDATLDSNLSEEEKAAKAKVLDETENVRDLACFDVLKTYPEA